MKLVEFEKLSVNEQADYIWNFQPLDERRENEHTILLYSLPDFYAEVYYHWGNNRIVSIRTFNTVVQLAPYLRK